MPFLLPRWFVRCRPAPTGVRTTADRVHGVGHARASSHGRRRSGAAGQANGPTRDHPDIERGKARTVHSVSSRSPTATTTHDDDEEDSSLNSVPTGGAPASVNTCRPSDTADAVDSRWRGRPTEPNRVARTLRRQSGLSNVRPCAAFRIMCENTGEILVCLARLNEGTIIDDARRDQEVHGVTEGCFVELRCLSA